MSGVLARWLVTVGEEVAAGQALGEVQREERRSVITAPKAGRVTMLADAIKLPISSSRIMILVDKRPGLTSACLVGLARDHLLWRMR